MLTLNYNTTAIKIDPARFAIAKEFDSGDGVFYRLYAEIGAAGGAVAVYDADADMNADVAIATDFAIAAKRFDNLVAATAM